MFKFFGWLNKKKFEEKLQNDVFVIELVDVFVDIILDVDVLVEFVVVELVLEFEVVENNDVLDVEFVEEFIQVFVVVFEFEVILVLVFEKLVEEKKLFFGCLKVSLF